MIRNCFSQYNTQTTKSNFPFYENPNYKKSGLFSSLFKTYTPSQAVTETPSSRLGKRLLGSQNVNNKASQVIECKDGKSKKLLRSLQNCPQFQEQMADLSNSIDKVSIRALSRKSCDEAGISKAAVAFKNDKEVDIYYDGDRQDLDCKKSIIFEIVNASKTKDFLAINEQQKRKINELTKNTIHEPQETITLLEEARERYAVENEEIEWLTAKRANEICQSCLGEFSYPYELVSNFKEYLTHQEISGHTDNIRKQWDNLYTKTTQ